MSSWGTPNLRFDDTHPTKEETEYVDSIEDSVKWLGYHWDGLYYASDYFDQLYEWAIRSSRRGKRMWTTSPPTRSVNTAAL
jgi:glutaminyl-tRNA synthetase